jgi:hypothetical protein
MARINGTVASAALWEEQKMMHCNISILMTNMHPAAHILDSGFDDIKCAFW